MNETPEAPLRRLISLSVAMCESGRVDAWNDVAALESERGRLLRECFAMPIAREAAGDVAKTLARILALDAELIALGVAAQRKLAADLEAVERGGIATDAYRNVQGNG